MKKIRTPFFALLFTLIFLSSIVIIFYPYMNASAHRMEAKNHLHNITANEAVKLLSEDKTITILDIRTPEEFSLGHIKNAINIDYYAPDFEEKITALPTDKTYAIHCASGRRSTTALKTFEKVGFTHIFHIEDGFNAWKEK